MSLINEEPVRKVMEYLGRLPTLTEIDLRMTNFIDPLRCPLLFNENIKVIKLGWPLENRLSARDFTSLAFLKLELLLDKCTNLKTLLAPGLGKYLPTYFEQTALNYRNLEHLEILYAKSLSIRPKTFKLLSNIRFLNLRCCAVF